MIGISLDNTGETATTEEMRELIQEINRGYKAQDDPRPTKMKERAIYDKKMLSDCLNKKMTKRKISFALHLHQLTINAQIERFGLQEKAEYLQNEKVIVNSSFGASFK